MLFHCRSLCTATFFSKFLFYTSIAKMHKWKTGTYVYYFVQIIRYCKCCHHQSSSSWRNAAKNKTKTNLWCTLLVVFYLSNRHYYFTYSVLHPHWSFLTALVRVFRVTNKHLFPTKGGIGQKTLKRATPCDQTGSHPLYPSIHTQAHTHTLQCSWWCDWPERTCWTRGRRRVLLFCTDVSPHIHERVTSTAGFALARRPLTQPALFGPAASQAQAAQAPPHPPPPFDCDGPWKPGDVRSCNNINALRQVFKSGTCLIIITT